MMDSEEAIEHEAWKDVSDNTGYNYHWHNTLVETEDTAEYRSIRLADEDEETLASLRGSGWTIELYPDPDNDGHMSRWRFEGDSAKEEAFEKVRELMEEYKDP